jgi:DNA topoisomerase-1
VLALIVTLLEQTLIRIGNYEYARTNDTYGLTTLNDEHVSVNGSKISFDFVGKSGVSHKVTIKDKRLAALVRACQDLPGHDLFQYVDDNGISHAIGSADVNAYLMEITGSAFTAKVFRTWGGSSLMTDILCAMPPVATKKEREKQVREGIKQVAAALQNTIAVCRKYYVHPTVVEAHLTDELQKFYNEKPTSDDPFALTACERTLLRLLKSA